MRKDSLGSFGPFVGPYTKHQWWIIGALLISYLAVYEANAYLLPRSLGLHLGTPIALAALFFGGIRLWPVVYLTSLLGVFISHGSLPALLFIPLAVTLQALAGAYFLRRAGTDPLFRRLRDSLSLVSTVLGISALSATATALVAAFRHTPYSLLIWGHDYAASVFCFVIITPFLLRWFAKLRFSRTWPEVAELVVVFGALIALDYIIFIERIGLVFGIALVYLLLIPLFYIALRLRPRFVTLALLITSGFGVASVLLYGTNIELQIFSMGVFLTVLAFIFNVITAIEEDRRANFNLAKSQLAALENAVARISSESSAKNDFIAILAHELRNPLAPVVSGVEMLRLKGAPDAETNATLDLMTDRLAAVRKLLDDLLDISRITEGKVALRREQMDLRQCISRAILSTEHLRKERHQSLAYREAKEPLSVRGDALRLEQVFSNLLTNASKYSPSGSSIRLRARNDDTAVEIEVIDQGVGIAPSALEKIFLPFHQAEPGKRTQSGLGIGLALVKSFVEMHGGTVVAASEGPGKGSRFVVRLPADAAKRSEPRAEQEPPAVALREAEDPGAHSILVVDDNEAAAAGIGRLLQFSGHAVSYAHDGAQAIEQVSLLSPDIVFLDVGLPDMDGYAVARTLRAEGYVGRLVGLSGYSTSEAKEQASAAGFDAYLIKPVSLSDLQKALTAREPG